MGVKIWVRQPLRAQQNMDLDAALLEKNGGNFLEFHRWSKPSFTFGYFVKAEEEFIFSDQIDVGKRSTGGGILYHGHDLSFAFSFDSSCIFYDMDTLKIYSNLNNFFSSILFQSNICPTLLGTGDFSHKNPYCWSNPTKYDVVYQGKKILGCAIRRKGERILYHASIPLRQLTSNEISPFLKRGDEIVEKILANTYDIGWKWDELRERISDHVTKIG